MLARNANENNTINKRIGHKDWEGWTNEPLFLSDCALEILLLIDQVLQITVVNYCNFEML